MTLPYGDVDVAGAAVHDPALFQRGDRPGRHRRCPASTSPPHRSCPRPSGYLSTEGLPARPGPGSTILLTDAMFERPAPPLATTEGRQVVVTSTGAAAGRSRPRRPDRDHRDAPAAAVRGRGPVPAPRRGRR